ncbi:MAG: hypothetical protein WD794_09470 [Mycobacteriales bacterium]
MTGRGGLLALGSVLTALLLTAGITGTAALVARQEAVEHRVVVATAEVGIRSAGRVVVRGADRTDLRITSRLRWAFGRPAVEVVSGGGRTDLRTRCPAGHLLQCRVELLVEVPRGTSVQIRGGGVDVTDLDGPLEVASHGAAVDVRDAHDVRISASGGQVRVTRISGRVEVELRGGSLRAEQLTAQQISVDSRGGRVRVDVASPPRRVEIEARGGGVDVLLPRVEGGYDVQSSVVGGQSRVEVDSRPGSGRVVRLDSHGGRVRVAYR